MDYSEALKLLKEGNKLFRKGWNGIQLGVVMYVYLVEGAEIDAGLNGIISPDPFFIFYHDLNRSNNVWLPSTWDMMGEDWVVYN